MSYLTTEVSTEETLGLHLTTFLKFDLITQEKFHDLPFAWEVEGYVKISALQ